LVTHGSLRLRLVDARLARQAVVACGCAAVVWMIFLREFGPADLSVFVRAGQSVADGVSPYIDPSSPAVWSGHAFVYPYPVAWAFIPFNELSMATTGLLFYGASVAALVASVRMLAGPRVGALPIALAVTTEPVVRSLQLGTLNVWLLFGLALAWRYQRRTGVLVVALTAVIVGKLFLLPMLAWLVLTGRARAAAAAALLGGAVVVIGCAMADLSLGSYGRMLSVLSYHEAPQSSSVAGRLEHLGASSAAATGVAVALAVLIIAVGWTMSRRRNNEAYLFCGCVAASLAASPIVWTHYFTLLLLIPLTLNWRRRSQVIAWGMTWLLGTPVSAPSFRIPQPVHGIALACAGILVSVAVRSALRRVPAGTPDRRRLRQERDLSSRRELSSLD
jgi:hypothetical protein